MGMKYHNVEYVLKALHDLGYASAKGYLSQVKRGPGFKSRQYVHDFIDSAIRDLYEKHRYSMRQVAAAVGVRYNTILLHLHDMGAEIRSRGGPNNYRHGRKARKKQKSEQGLA